MKKAIRISAVLCCLTGVLGSTGPSVVRATGASAFPIPGPGIINTIGGAPTSAPSTSLSIYGSVSYVGGRVLVNRNGRELWALNVATSTATKLAGSGFPGYGGDGGRAIDATVSFGGSAAGTALGDIYIPDTDNFRVRKIDVNGIITTVAGTGIEGFSGDGGAATSAELDYPAAVAALTDGTLFISDTSNYRIRKVAPDGKISTIAGNGLGGASTGDLGQATSATLGGAIWSMVADPAGNVYFLSDGGSKVRKVTPAGIISTIAGTGAVGSTGDGGLATSATINASDLSISSTGTIVIAQADRIRQVIGGTISTLLASPAQAVAAGPAGTVYFTDSSFYVYQTAGGPPTVIAGNGQYRFSPDGGQAIASEFGYEKSIILLGDGSLVMAEYGNGRVRKISPTGVVSTLAGGGATPPDTGVVATDAQVCPRGVAKDSLSTIYFVDDCSYTVFAIDAGGRLQRIAGTGAPGVTPEGGPANQAPLESPHGLAIDAAGNLYIDTYGAVRKVTTNGIISRYAGTGDVGYSGDGGAARFAQIGSDAELAVDPQGDLYISEHDFDVIRRVTPDGKIDTYAGGGSGPDNGDGGPAVGATLNTPENIVVDSVGNLYIADKFDHRIRRVFRTNGFIETIAGSGSQGQVGDGGPALSASFAVPYGIAIDSRGTVYVGDDSTGRLRIIGGPDWSGSYISLPPNRILDTREGVGAPKAMVGQGQSIDLTVLGVGGVPATGVSGVILNVTATNPTAASFVTVWPTGDGRPTASSLNFSAGETIPNTVTAHVGAGGKISLFNATGAVDLVADVVGYFSAGEALGARQVSLAPSRILDTREPIGVPAAQKVAGGSAITVKVLGVGGVPLNTGVSAVILNVTATEPDAASFVTVWPTGEDQPVASSLNFVPGQTVPNQVFAKVGANGSINLFNAAGSVHLVADVVGYFTQAADPIGAVVSLFTPNRILDTRLGLGVPAVAQVGQAGTINLKVTGVAGVPSTGVTAVVLNLTATQPTAPSFVTVWPTGTDRPVASSLNFVAGETIPNQVIAKVGSGGSISLYNNTGSVDLVADIVGYYT